MRDLANAARTAGRYDRAMQSDESFGVIPVRGEPGAYEFLLIQHKAGHWGFPKGHADPGETPIETALRELTEETGLSVEALRDRPGFEESYVFTKLKSGKRVLKRVTFYVGRVGPGEPVPCPKEVRGVAWGDAASTRARLTFDEGRALFDQVLAYLEEHPLGARVGL